MKAKRIISASVVALVVLFIFSNSLLKGSSSSQVSGGFTNFIWNFFNNVGVHFDKYALGTFVRKCGHFLEFSVLGASLFSMFQSFNGKRLKNAEHILFFGMSVGLTDEIIQHFIEGRGPSVLDVALDFSGVVSGMFAAFCGLLIIIKLHSKKEKVR